MPTIIFGFLVLVLVLWALNAFSKINPKIAARSLKAGRRVAICDQMEAPKPGDPAFTRCETRIIAAPQASLEAAAEVARRAGYRPIILGDALEGEAKEVGKVMAGIARQVAVHGQPAPSPCVLISGGETTVTVGGAGKGGRNVEFLLSMAVELDGRPRIFAIAGDTDGVDGAEEVAGAIVTPDSLERARRAGSR